MKVSLLVLAGVLTAAMVMAGDGAPSVTYASHEKVAAAFVKGGGLAKGSDYSVGAMVRTAAGASEMHDKQTDVYYVADGEATFVTGGKVIGDKVVSPGQHQGTGIEGGEVRQISKGDVIVIPAGVPHWFKAVPHSVHYLLVKVEKP
jgi:mannose-6-phosphate isomerase-like protein (cupin superfamily)